MIPWIAACQAPLSIEFSRREYWSGILEESLLQGSPWSRDWTQVSYIADRFFTVWATSQVLYVEIFPSAMTDSRGGPGALPETGTISVMQLTLRAPCRSSWDHILAQLLTPQPPSSLPSLLLPPRPQEIIWIPGFLPAFRKPKSGRRMFSLERAVVQRHGCERAQNNSEPLWALGRGVCGGGAGQKPDGCPDVSQHPASHIPPLHSKLTSDIPHGCLQSNISANIYSIKWVSRGRSYKSRFLDLFSSILQSRNKDELPEIFWLPNCTASVEMAPDSTFRRANYLGGCFCPSLPLQKQWPPPCPFYWLLSSLASTHEVLPLDLC